ncbi:hypothetical protein FQ775_13950 [Nitratireductor mangrovi]|uniref:Alkaline proteinase inhibitor/ Outer membrane lipoprotein Omp19 domain-containing protein n=1 Tax=Nitratireductor mangrovi TaxID=2599600 RepID=A0A5B8L0H2_9HYPH|nr:hypothetical protein [Nitratireductor mangrovi]QDZ01391.2 hypothetical protein FQ775_13950 [Nitratireductor mangrovi]
MRILPFGLAGLVAVAWLQTMAGPGRQAIALAEDDVRPDGYWLRQVGSADGCSVAFAEPGTDAVTAIVPEAGCAALHPEMASVRFQREDGDGLMSFVSEAGETVIQFAIADGVAYESLKPATPLFQLEMRGEGR